ncbi:hypothetical protein IV203_011926 [Nitzschia inconspicua]|uniref:Uncharacterized protein n=1 Tax=Nitzschia inconspicua TaxID=303405 RepID=A0A9K3KU22_9STRA|nr:hypothetical protein IV203_011926 [Nitzschia inconspicua]
MLRRRTKPVVAAKPNGPLWIAEDPFRGDRALLVDDDAVAPLSGDNHLSTALVDYLLQRSLQPSDLQDTTLVGSANFLHFFHQVNAKISIAHSDPNVVKSVENIRQRCSHYKDNKFEFISPFCNFVVVKIVFDLRSPDIFHEVSVYYDSLIKAGSRNNSVHRNSPPAKYSDHFSNSLPTFVHLGTPSVKSCLPTPTSLWRRLSTDRVPCNRMDLTSQNDYHEDVFLRLLADLPDNCNDIHAAPDDPDKALLPGLDDMPLNPRLGADPQPKPTTYRDNYFTSQFIEVPKEFEDMS